MATSMATSFDEGDVIHTALGPLVIPEGMGGHYVVSDSLDAAWAEAEAALPDNGEQIAGLTPTGVGGWYAHAYNIAGERCDGIGPTPAAALRALASKLRERGA